MLELLNYTHVSEKRKIYPDHFLWTPELFEDDGLDPNKIKKTINKSLPGLVKVNNIGQAEVRKNDTTNGLDIRYGSTPNGVFTSLFNPSQKLVDQALLRFGPVPKPTLINVDFTAQFAVNQRECFHVFAVTSSAIYSLFNIYQGTVDGNYSYGSSGFWNNNTKTKLKSLTAKTTYTGTLNVSSMTNCFTAGETECDIAIVRLQKAYWEGNSPGMRNASTLYIKKLEIY